MKNYKVGGLFSGVGGIELGFQNQGFDITWANEIDVHCSKTYQLNFKHKFILEDIHKIKGSSLEPVDVLTGGFPCQAFSVAGYRKGLKDERGNLFYEILRLINELKYKPKVLLLDECFAALDVLTIKMLQEIIVNLQSENKITICICDHQARDLLACVDVAMILSSGKIIAQDTPSNLVNNINAKNAYFGDNFKFN